MRPSAPSDAASALSTAQRQARVVELVNDGWQFREIADELGISKSQAHRLFHAGVNRIPAENVQAYRERQLADIELARSIVLEELAIHHVTVSNGYVVREITGRDEDGKPIYGEAIEDRGPVMAAVDRLIKLSQREAEILGSNAASKMTADVSVNYTVAGVDTGALT